MKGVIADSRPCFSGLEGRLPEELFSSLSTPCYIIDEGALRKNGKILNGVRKRTGCKILLAQKAFSSYDFYRVLSPFIDGSEASGLYEARLGYEKLPNKEVHVFCAAYREDEFDELLEYADHIVFNSPSQLEKFAQRVKKAGKSAGLRINPEYSTQEGHEIYDPCAPGSRLGTTREQWDKKMTPDLIKMLDGLHFHTLCEQNADALQATLASVEEKFGDVLPRVKWLNFGGGHHITRPDYDISLLEKCICRAQKKWGVEVYLEPGEACALNSGYLACRVLDVVENQNIKIAIIDASAACHMPDVIEMPYHPPLYGEKSPDSALYKYTLGGPTCLAGDIAGEFGFDRELKAGDLLLFGDMAIYTTCKNNTFNGMKLPDLYALDGDKKIKCIKSFGYEDFKGRLGG